VAAISDRASSLALRVLGAAGVTIRLELSHRPQMLFNL